MFSTVPMFLNVLPILFNVLRIFLHALPLFLRILLTTVLILFCQYFYLQYSICTVCNDSFVYLIRVEVGQRLVGGPIPGLVVQHVMPAPCDPCHHLTVRGQICQARIRRGRGEYFPHTVKPQCPRTGIAAKRQAHGESHIHDYSTSDWADVWDLLQVHYLLDDYC